MGVRPRGPPWACLHPEGRAAGGLAPLAVPRDGTWQRIFTTLQAQADARDLITWDLNVDSSVVRAHQHAAGARKGGTCRKSRPAVQSQNRPTTGSGARAAA
ncbi:insertion element transposase [Streptomyces sparsogenes DSM 40356]|uniref:Insertion element transposase n=1 Tax=Streptomyces sparsogenes DSM 40356 TaxID=1331668 RepID=A0A1R1SGB8_9ACTN|nr:insertion element transposase [Streptomyces sparsogenes DSM 40356]